MKCQNKASKTNKQTKNNENIMGKLTKMCIEDRKDQICVIKL